MASTLNRLAKLSVVCAGIVVAAMLVPPPREAEACGSGLDQCAALPGTPCTRNSECSSPLMCQRGICMPQCREDRDCSCPNLGGVSGLFACVRDQYGIGSCVLKTPTALNAACVNAFDCDSRACVSGRCR